MSAVSRGETPKRPNGLRVTDRRWTFIQQCWSSPSTVDMSPLIVEFAKNDLKLAIESHLDTGGRVDPGQSTSDDDKGLSVPVT